MAIAHFTDRESLSWRGDMAGPGKPQFIVPRREVVAEAMRRDDILQGGNQDSEAKKGEKWCGRRREEETHGRTFPKSKVLSIVPPDLHFLIICLP